MTTDETNVNHAPFLDDLDFRADQRRLHQWLEMQAEKKVELTGDNKFERLNHLIHCVGTYIGFLVADNYKTNQPKQVVETLNPFVVVHDALLSLTSTCQKVGVSERSLWVISQPLFVRSVLRAVITSYDSDAEINEEVLGTLATLTCSSLLTKQCYLLGTTNGVVSLRSQVLPTAEVQQKNLLLSHQYRENAPNPALYFVKESLSF